MLKGDISGLYGDDEVIIADGRLNAEYVSDAVSEAVPGNVYGMFTVFVYARSGCVLRRKLHRKPKASVKKPGK